MTKAKASGPGDEGRAAKRAAAAAQRKREADDLRAHRSEQLVAAQEVLGRIETSLDGADKRVASYKALTSHLTGFYEEVDKLAKGKTFVEATELVVQQINDIVRDAKSIIGGDPYLERVKEFVPAGNNPVYPDVLMVARTVQQCLARSNDEVLSSGKRLAKALREGRTIVGALKAFLASESWPLQEEVAARVTGKVDESWFFNDEDDQSCFDFERLDRDGVARLDGKVQD